MPWILCSLVLAFLDIHLTTGGMDACYNSEGRAQRCMPIFENAAFGKEVEASNTCGTPPEDYCFQMGTRDSTALCHRCDAGDPQLHHNAVYLTDFHNQEEPTWWQSQSMAFGVQHPNSVNITLHLGKSYEITYVRLKFHTSRPESFAIYKRSRVDGPWIPYQFYSASCRKTYGKPEHGYLRPGEDEQVAFCTDEFSDISPLSGGNVAFSTLEGRPSAYSFDQSSVLQEWVTGTDLLISLDRLNTFGDDIFKDPKVLKSYYYAISDFSVGGRCKCNGHASECVPNEEDQLVCLCQHNTTGVDCDTCQPFYQDRPWARGTAESANECLPCNCSGKSEECFYDWELYRATGHGGHCQNCRDNTDGPHCERCLQNFYRWEDHLACQPCNCNPAGSMDPQCDSSGACECKDTVTGWKCERCRDGFHSLNEGGCRPCACDPSGSRGTCDPNTGHCTCKERVEGYLCNRCQPGSFNLQIHNPTGCTSCFCYGHSTACTSAPGYEAQEIISDFSQGLDGWRAEDAEGMEISLQWSRGEVSRPEGEEKVFEFLAPEKFLHDQRFSYGQLLSVSFCAEGEADVRPSISFWLVLEGDHLFASASSTGVEERRNRTHCKESVVTFRLDEAQEHLGPPLSAFQFQRLLSNLTALRIHVENRPGRVSLTEIRLISARPGLSQVRPAPWVEECICPQGYVGQFCEACAPGYTREMPFGGPLVSCVLCSCNQHGSCDPNTGLCQCQHNTEGPSCERCAPGFYGDPFGGRFDDCKPCPCPGGTPCTTMPESGEVVCIQCPPGLRGKLCELCEDGFFGDPLGKSGPTRPCTPCECNHNVDPNAVGNCDPVSGRCLRCVYNTTGDHCERCQENFYGNPLAAEPLAKCAPCNCNPRGSAKDPGACNHITGQCPCLPHVAGRDCSHCQDGYYNLEPGTGCKSCLCHPVGSQHGRCDQHTGQCKCRPGVEGASCDWCQPGFFGFSYQGCRACNCSQFGSASPQCHENSTCVCRKGFIGYKCDQCAVNYFYDPGSRTCQECPLCYGLVKEEADKLKAQLSKMEAWLQKPNCGKPWAHQYHAMLEEAPRGDNLHHRSLLKGAKEAFLEEIAELEGLVSDVQNRLRNASEMLGCNGYADTKTCALLSDIQPALQSARLQIQWASMTLEATGVPFEISHQSTNQSHQALESRMLAQGHVMAAILTEDTARKAILLSNATHLLLEGILEDDASPQLRREMEKRYRRIQRIQEQLRVEMERTAAKAKETFASVHQVSADMGKDLSWISSVDLLPLHQQAKLLSLEAGDLEEQRRRKERLVVNGSLDIQTELQEVLPRMRQLQKLWQRTNDAHVLAVASLSNGEMVVSEAKTLITSLNGVKKLTSRQKGPSSLHKKMAAVKGKVITEAQKKTRQAQRLLGDSFSVSAKAQKTAQDGEIQAHENVQKAERVLRGAKREKRRADKLTADVTLTVAEISRQERQSAEIQGNLIESEQVATEVNDLSRKLQGAQDSLKRDIAALSNLLVDIGNLDHASQSEAALNASRTQLERLQVHLWGPGALGQKLDTLQQEAEQQQLRIEAFEKDLQEIQRDKENLEAILRSLPDGCSSWK